MPATTSTLLPCNLYSIIYACSDLEQGKLLARAGRPPNASTDPRLDHPQHKAAAAAQMRRCRRSNAQMPPLDQQDVRNNGSFPSAYTALQPGFCARP